MNALMIERGPDRAGCFFEGPVAFAHRRLSIIDLSDAGRQPMVSVDGRCIITFNGEIYNFRELRAELEARGRAFATRTDTEVVLNGYAEWGLAGMLSRLDGMFAFALFDRREGKLALGRDRFGKKPLYYLDRGARFKFASDIRAIQVTEPSLGLDYEALDFYLTELTVPQPRTIWRDVLQLRPAHYLEIDLTTGTRRSDRYWTLTFEGDSSLRVADVEDEVERLLRRAVAKRTVADVPIGAFLSGGTDSGLVVASLAGALGAGVKTFTVGFEGDGDETAAARRVAERYGTDHTEIIVGPDIREDLPGLVDYFGEPFADSSAVPSYYVSRAIGRHVKVALSGDGGDELFGGYHDYAWAHLTDVYLARHSSLLRPAVSAWSKVAHRMGVSSTNYGHYEAYAVRPPHLKLHREMGFAPDGAEIHGPQFPREARGFARAHLAETWRRHQRATLEQTLSQASLETRLLNDYLVKVDRASMRSSVEVRSPFLDVDLAEFMARVAGPLKYGPEGIPKYLLRRLAARLVDVGALAAPKRGFGIPIGAWLRQQLRPMAADLLLSGALRRSGLVRQETVERLFTEHQAGADHTDRLWCLLVLALWLGRNLP